MMLKKKIAAAFADVPVPADENMTHCPYRRFECTAVAGYFEGMKWTDISATEDAIGVLNEETQQL